MAEDQEPSSTFLTAPRWQNWIAKARWFAAEILVVVTGVLIAFTLGGWWEGLQDRKKERAYLHQLYEDLTASERLITQADLMYGEIDRRAGMLVRAFRMRSQPPADSVTAWIAGGFWHEPLTPVMATAEALVSTGDITLIRNDSLRAEVTRYVGSMNKALERQQVWSAEYYRAVDRLAESIDFVEILLQSVSQDRINGLARSSIYVPFPEDPVARTVSDQTPDLFGNEQAYRALWMANNWKSNLASTRTEMLVETRGLREVIRQELSN